MSRSGKIAIALLISGAITIFLLLYWFMPCYIESAEQTVLPDFSRDLVTHDPPQITAYEPRDYTPLVISHVRNMMEYGTNYNMLVSVLDIQSKQMPVAAAIYGSRVRTEGRDHRRATHGANLWNDLPLLRVMWRLAYLDYHNHTDFRDAANAYVLSYTERCLLKNGMFAWGSHVFCHILCNAPSSASGHHEILKVMADWRSMYTIIPNKVRTQIELMWKFHVVNKMTGEHNRHDDLRESPKGFAMAGASLIHAFAFMSNVSSDPLSRDLWKNRSLMIARFHWRGTHALVADVPNPGKTSPDARHAFSTTPAFVGMALYHAYDMTGDVVFRTMAEDHVIAWEKYAWDNTTGDFWGMVSLYGTPIRRWQTTHAYSYWLPAGKASISNSPMFSYSFLLAAAQTAAWAWRIQPNNSVLERVARNYAMAILRQLPMRSDTYLLNELRHDMPKLTLESGAFAEDYGRAISFFMNMYHVSNEQYFKNVAETVARNAVDKLWVENATMFRSYPLSNYCESIDGIGIFLHSLLELTLFDAPTFPAF